MGVFVLVGIAMPMPAAAVDIFQASQHRSMLVRVLVTHDLDEFSVMLVAMAMHLAVRMVVIVVVSMIVVVIMRGLILVLVGMIVVMLVGVVIVLIVSMIVFVFVRVLIVFVFVTVFIIVFIVPVVVIVFVRVVIIVFMRVVVIVLVRVPSSSSCMCRANRNDLDASRDFHDGRVIGRTRDHSEQRFFNTAAVDED